MSNKHGLPRGIDKMANGRYRVRMTYDYTQYFVGIYDTKTDAKAALDIARAEKARKVFVPASEQRRAKADNELRERLEALTVAEWADDWLERLRGAKRTPATIRSYRSTLDAHIVPAIGARRLLDVKQEHVDAMLAGLASKPGARTNAARVTRSLFLAAVAAKAGGLDSMPVRIEIPSTRSQTAAPLERAEVATPEQVRDLAAAMPPPMRIAVTLAAWCALRQGEVLGLQRGDFENLDEPTRAAVHIDRQWNVKTSPPSYAPPKAGSRRVVAIPPALVPAIVAHLEAHTPAEDDAPLMPRRGSKRAPVSQTALDNAWRTARAGILPGFRFHSLRHTGLTEYARLGATLAELKERGGHKSAEVAMRYQHATRERDRALAADLPVPLD